MLSIEFGEFGEFSNTTLTSVRNEGATLAKAAVERLVTLMETDRPPASSDLDPPARRTRYPRELVSSGATRLGVAYSKAMK
jgi:LacI family transcriptional regulator